MNNPKVKRTHKVLDLQLLLLIMENVTVIFCNSLKQLLSRKRVMGTVEFFQFSDHSKQQ